MAKKPPILGTRPRKDQEMNKTLCMLCVAGLSGAALAQGADGTVRFNGVQPYGGANGGGEFSMTSTAGPNLFGNFQSFCIELNENLSIGASYTFDVATEARNGGVGGGNPDPLSAKTAALYEAFWFETLANYDFDNDGDGGEDGNLNRTRTAEALQAAIWELEDERDVEDTTSNADVVELARYYVDTLAQELVDQGLGGRVRVLNMYRVGSNVASQDVLVLVPLPHAGALAGLGLAGIAVRRRRRTA
jgi:hypothetical protein